MLPCAVFVAATRDVFVQQLRDTWGEEMWCERFVFKDSPWGRGEHEKNKCGSINTQIIFKTCVILHLRGE